MSVKTMAWQVGGNGAVQRLPECQPELETHLEDWIEKDPSIISGDLLLIGRQQPTAFGTYIDLLGINIAGDLVILELKRDKSLRDTVAQALEYAAWSASLNFEQIVDVAAKRFGNQEAFEKAFESKFSADLPDTLNQAQQIFIIAPQISEATRATIEYLAETFGVPINGVSFGMFDVSGSKILVREMVLTDEEQAAKSPTKRRPTPTIEQALALADENGVGDIARYFYSLRGNFLAPGRLATGWSYSRTIQGKSRVLLGIHVTKENRPSAVSITLGVENFASAFGKMIDNAREFLESLIARVGQRELPPWSGWLKVSVRTMDEARTLVRDLETFFGTCFRVEATP